MEATMTDLRIDQPCHEHWDRMSPSARGRFCASCRKEVVDLSDLPAAVGRQRMQELRDRLRERPASSICVRGEGDGRGGLLTPARRRLLTNGFAAMLAMSVAGCTGDGPAAPTQVTTRPAAASQDQSPPGTTAPASQEQEPSDGPIVGIGSRTVVSGSGAHPGVSAGSASPNKLDPSSELSIPSEIGVEVDSGDLGDDIVVPRPQPLTRIHAMGGVRSAPVPPKEPVPPKNNG
jgi:hypothetical protein